MLDQQDAIIRLLQDDDPETVSLVKEQLLGRGTDVIGDLRNLVACDNANVSRHAREVLDTLQVRQAEHEFTLFCYLFPDDGDLEHASWLVAKAMLPGIEAEKYQHQLDAWGRQLTLRASGAISVRERVAALSEFMAQELGFRGNSRDYYNVKNSLLPSVIDTRLGIPISLSVLYMLVGARAGMKIEGVSLPGHFIVRHSHILIDPFHSGRILCTADCEQILARQKLKMKPTYFEAAPARLILFRTLLNLAYIFKNKGDAGMQNKIAGWLKGLERR